MELSVLNVKKVVYAAVVMHNLLIARRPQLYLRQVAEQANPEAIPIGKTIYKMWVGGWEALH